MDDASPEPVAAFDDPLDIGAAVGHALRRQRVAAGLAIRELGRLSGVSSAMISRIENGQVSPSLSTLESLARAMQLPVIALFQNTLRTADVTFVKAGAGLEARRFAPGHVHDYRMLASFGNGQMRFTAASVTLERTGNGTHPVYHSRGYVFLTVTEGRCLYACGDAEYAMEPGDCLSFDAQLRHTVREVLSETVTFVTVAARPD
ncbi:helix-turn-helix domain-containing protein [Thetidibacter halocola]|uniref:Helix-turn-helix transcriptional regulator n=1 Tax=Thetidibacter halocola TaxID=2827239 RepID=A0A8J7WAQ0_9RHOB|nr:XRE family transcriptional regulator [Thetidibacter halocola]MBS0124072.1 helix-turn-helix transcriptional regulator [Thetidibacter halocola]